MKLALTRREAEVAALLVQGFANKQIAETLVLEEESVKFHMTNLMRKLGVDNRTMAALRLQRDGFDGQ